MRRLSLPLTLLATLTLPAGAAAAGQPQPSARDRADARAYLVAYAEAKQAAAKRAKTVPDIMSGPQSVCGGVLKGHSTSGANVFVLIELDGLAMTQQVARVLTQFSAALDRVHAHDPVLAAYAAFLRGQVLAALAPFTRLPRIDVCAALAAWKASGFKPGFDLAAATHTPAPLVAKLRQTMFGGGSFIPDDKKLDAQVQARLVAFGIPQKAAHAFVTQS